MSANTIYHREVNPSTRQIAMEVLQRYAAEAGPEAQAVVDQAADPNRAERRAGKPRRRDKTLNWISSIIPPQARHLFRGVGMIAVASYILMNVKRIGISKEYYGTIAAKCGVCRKTVQRTVAALRQAGLAGLMAGLMVTGGGYDPATGKSRATVITSTGGKLDKWISRNPWGGGQTSASSMNIDRPYLAVWRPVNEWLHGKGSRRGKPPD
jgi:hypothetical protein